MKLFSQLYSIPLRNDAFSIVTLLAPFFILLLPLLSNRHTLAAPSSPRNPSSSIQLGRQASVLPAQGFASRLICAPNLGSVEGLFKLALAPSLTPI
mmetsp:Transcript_21135/g.34078  ORF Transcript_21135/g.34078 Transcript_21135/m.34078 type:complete len:96 (+) Transcript_21135:310-597(+)